MNRFLMATAATALSATGAFAAVDLDQLDLDANNFVSIEELRASFPEVTANDFELMDANDDNRLSREEVTSPEGSTILDRYEMQPDVARGPVVVLDDDSDGYILLEDLRRAYSGFTDLDFDTMDTNDDNRLTYAEYYDIEAQNVVARYGMTNSVADIAEIDTNGDGFADFDEMMAQYPGIGELELEQIDLNGDNQVSSNELYEADAQQIVSRFR